MAVGDGNDRVARRRYGGNWGWGVGAIVLMLVLALLAIFLVPLFGADEEPAETVEPVAPAAKTQLIGNTAFVHLRGTADQGATIDDITAEPNNFYGQTVTVSGEVNEIIGPRSFTIGGQDFLGGSELLVVSAQQLPVPEGRPADQPLVTHDIVQVTGTVRRFNLAQIEDEIGVDLDDSLFTEFRGEPVVVARRVDVTARVSPGLPQAPDAALTPNVTIDDIAEEPSVYVGQQVTVTGDVQQELGPNAFVIGSDELLAGEDLLVIGTQPFAPAPGVAEGGLFTEDMMAKVTGTVRIFDIVEFEREFGLALQDNLFTEFEGQPAIVADQVVPMPGISDLAENTAEWIGQTVTVKGDIAEVLSSRAFLIEEDTFLGIGSNEILVVSAPQVPAFRGDGLGLVQDDTVRVTGTVRAFNLRAIERELGANLQDNLFTEFEGQAVIIATKVTPLSFAGTGAGE